MLAVQFVGAVIVYYITLPMFGATVAQGAMICVLAPIAMAAVVIAGMLGANVAPMVTYSLICNFVTALLVPPMLHLFGNGSCTFAEIIGRVAPTLIAPFVVAQACRWLLPKVAQWFASHSIISYPCYGPHNTLYYQLQCRVICRDSTCRYRSGVVCCAVLVGKVDGTLRGRRGGLYAVGRAEEHYFCNMALAQLP